MYKVAVPVTNLYPDREMDCEGTLKELRRAGASRVWLCSARGIEGEEKLAAQIEKLKEHIAFFEKNGMEVGVWISSFGHGGALIQDDPDALARSSQYVKLVGMNGTTCDDTFCPSGEAFQRDYVDWVGRLAGTGAKIIMMDDDFRLCVRSTGNGCCCDWHMAEYRRRVGEDVKREALKDLVFRGGRNKYRDAWLDMGRDTLLDIARKLRERVDQVNPNVRLGMATVLSTWDVDGVDAVELAKTLAGGTKPFLRLSGAPYWCATGFWRARPAYVIEVSRMEIEWCRGQGVETFSEADSYPRPRYMCPASYVEAFDQGLRADGGTDGILKYVLDYTSSLKYETGYVDAAVRNAPVYDWIEKNLRGRTEGVNVVSELHRLKDADLPEGATLKEIEGNFFFSAAQQLLCDASLPMGYGISGPHAVFGENGRYATETQLDEGAVIDAPAARLLLARGVDVGVESLGEERDLGGVEYYPAYGEHVAVNGIGRFQTARLKPGAEALSRIGEETVCFRYENEKGQRFLVYAFDMWASLRGWGATRNYCRQRQLTEGLEWAGRRKLPAVCMGHPDLYIQCKRTAEGLAVGLWNLSADFIVDPVVETDAAYGAAEAFNARAELDGTRVRLRTEMAPYTFIGLVLKDERGGTAR